MIKHIKKECSTARKKDCECPHCIIGRTGSQFDKDYNISQVIDGKPIYGHGGDPSIMKSNPDWMRDSYAKQFSPLARAIDNDWVGPIDDIYFQVIPTDFFDRLAALTRHKNHMNEKSLFIYRAMARNTEKGDANKWESRPERRALP